ncbi:MAG: zinc-ribbon domain-containing protein, partial [Oscillospiraceae bacterium]
MICPNCNKPVNDGAKFCSGCGFKIEAAAPAEPAMPTAAAVEQPAPAEPAIPAAGEYVAPTATAVEQPAPAAQPVMPSAGEYVAPTATAVEQPAPAAQPVMPAAGEYVAPAAAVETTKAKAPKSGKKFPVIPVAAAGAAVVVAGAVGLGLTVFKADVTHTFMGDEKYAVAALQKATSGITDNAAP